MGRSAFTEKVLAEVSARNPAEPEFLQAVHEVLESIEPVVKKRPEIAKLKILERIVEPERQVIFRVPWVNDAGEIQVNGIYKQCDQAAEAYGEKENLVVGANIAGFLRVVDAMLAQGLV